MIYLTTKARTRISEILQEENVSSLFLRIFVQGGGCSGLQYGFTLDTIIDEDDELVSIADITIVIDAMSAQYLRGSEIDFVEDITGAHFKIKNPNAQSTCGCGNSFNATGWDI